MNLKLFLLAASLLALGGCVAPGYDYVRPGYSGSAGYYDGGYYTGGHYDGGGYYSDYYDGCCYPGGVSIGVGVGYGYPGYYAWGNYPYNYYGYNGYYYNGYYHGHGHHHHHGDHDEDDHHHGDQAGDHHDHHWDESAQDDIHDRYHRTGDRFDAGVQQWPHAQSRAPVRAPGPAWTDVTRPEPSYPQPQSFSQHVAPHASSHPDSGAAMHRPESPPQGWTPPRSSSKPKTQQF